MSQPVIPPPGAALIGAELDDDEVRERQEPQDVEDGTPVGRADHEADAERSGADPDDL